MRFLFVSNSLHKEGMMLKNWHFKTTVKNNILNILLELFPIQMLIFVFWDLAIISNYTDKSNIIIVVLGSLVIIVSLLCSIIYIFFIKKYSFNFVAFFNDKKYLIPIIIIFFICVCTTFSSWLNLDGFQYYKDLRRMRSFHSTKIKDLMLCGHMSQGYSVFLLIGEFLTPGNIIGARLVHCIMAVITIYCFYSIADTILIYSDKLDKVLYTALFSFSPLFLCTISELNTDFPLVCFFTWMVYFGIKEKYILQSFCGILLCFSKEPGCILYGFYIIGIVLYRLAKNRKEIAFKTLKIIITPDLCVAALGGILWVIGFATLNNKGWMKNTNISTVEQSLITNLQLNTFAINKEYIIHRFKQLLCVNFAWVFCSIDLVFICFAMFQFYKNFKKRIELKGEILFGIVLSFFSFLIYSTVYVTYDHYRYLIPFAFFLFFCTMISIDSVAKNSIIKKIMLSFLIFILLCSNFYTFDPISKSVFVTEGTGIDKILLPNIISIDNNNNIVMNDTDNLKYKAVINNSCIYNFQCSYMGSCFNRTLKRLNYNNNTLIILPHEYRDEWGTTASLFGINVKGYSEYYWDTQTERLNINCADEEEKMKNNSRYCKLNYKVVNSLEEVSDEERESFQRIYYIALPFQEDFDHEKFLAQSSSDLVDTVQYISWKWDVYQIK